MRDTAHPLVWNKPGSAWDLPKTWFSPYRMLVKSGGQVKVGVPGQKCKLYNASVKGCFTWDT